MNIIIMGPQGSGKSTQAELLSQQLNLPHIETGEIYRRLSQENSPLGQKVKEILDKGDLIDDQTTFEVVDKYLAAITGGFIIDGFPRTLIQAQRERFPIDKVVYLRLSDDQAVKRLMRRGRADDTPAVIKERLNLYHSQTEPILDHYRQSGKLVEIDGRGTIEQVNQLIKNAISP